MAGDERERNSAGGPSGQPSYWDRRWSHRHTLQSPIYQRRSIHGFSMFQIWSAFLPRSNARWRSSERLFLASCAVLSSVCCAAGHEILSGLDMDQSNWSKALETLGLNTDPDNRPPPRTASSTQRLSAASSHSSLSRATPGLSPERR